MVLTIFQPTFITMVLTLPRFITSGCYGAETNGRTTARIYFFINIDSHNTVLQKDKSRSQLNLLDFYNKHIIGRLSSATSSGLSPNISFMPGLFFRTLAQYRATLCFLIVKFTLGEFLGRPHSQRQYLLLGHLYFTAVGWLSVGKQ